MMKIGTDRVWKLQPVGSREDRKFERARARQNFNRLGITRNRMGTTIWPNDEDGKRSCTKISTGELSGEL